MYGSTMSSEGGTGKWFSFGGGDGGGGNDASASSNRFGMPNINIPGLTRQEVSEMEVVLRV